MINKLFFLLLPCFSIIHAMANTNLPVDTLGSKDATKPLVIYITGDGGLNSFSTAFMKQWNSKGYPVVALNAKSYFWKTKTPETAAKDISDLITEYALLWKRNSVILVGYSLGADVLPFVLTRMPQTLAGKVLHCVLLSPSENTDFTVHLFYSSNGGSNVPDEINKLTKPVLVIFGNKETDVPEKKINNKMATLIKVNGDHHYDNQIVFLVNEIIGRL